MAKNTVVQEPETSKTEDQLASEQNLDLAIPDELPVTDTSVPGQTEIAPTDATESLYGLLCLVPIGCSAAGLIHTAKVWNENACRTVATAAIPVFRKYAWGQRIIAFLEKGEGLEEFALVAAIAPLALATYSAVKLDTQKTETEKEAQNEN